MSLKSSPPRPESVPAHATFRTEMWRERIEVDGVPHGWQRRWARNGTPVLNVNFVRGQLTGFDGYYPDGTVSSKSRIDDDGVQHTESFRPDGSVWMQTSYVPQSEPMQVLRECQLAQDGSVLRQMDQSFDDRGEVMVRREWKAGILRFENCQEGDVRILRVFDADGHPDVTVRLGNEAVVILHKDRDRVLSLPANVAKTWNASTTLQVIDGFTLNAAIYGQTLTGHASHPAIERLAKEAWATTPDKEAPIADASVVHLLRALLSPLERVGSVGTIGICGSTPDEHVETVIAALLDIAGSEQATEKVRLCIRMLLDSKATSMAQLQQIASSKLPAELRAAAIRAFVDHDPKRDVFEALLGAEQDHAIRSVLLLTAVDICGPSERAWLEPLLADVLSRQGLQKAFETLGYVGEQGLETKLAHAMNELGSGSLLAALTTLLRANPEALVHATEPVVSVLRNPACSTAPKDSAAFIRLLATVRAPLASGPVAAGLPAGADRLEALAKHLEAGGAWSEFPCVVGTVSVPSGTLVFADPAAFGAECEEPRWATTLKQGAIEAAKAKGQPGVEVGVETPGQIFTFLAVFDLPTECSLDVVATYTEKGRLKGVSVLLTSEVPRTQTPIGRAFPEYARFLLVDSTVLAQFRDDSVMEDYRRDHVFFGPNAASLHAPPVFLGTRVGWLDLVAGTDEFPWLIAQRETVRGISGHVFAHTDEYNVWKEMMTSPAGMASAKVFGADVFGTFTEGSKSAHTVVLERDAEGKPCRVTLPITSPRG